MAKPDWSVGTKQLEALRPADGLDSPSPSYSGCCCARLAHGRLRALLNASGGIQSAHKRSIDCARKSTWPTATHLFLATIASRLAHVVGSVRSTVMNNPRNQHTS